jgi:hypothetical protein
MNKGSENDEGSSGGKGMHDGAARGRMTRAAGVARGA